MKSGGDECDSIDLLQQNRVDRDGHHTTESGDDRPGQATIKIAISFTDLSSMMTTIIILAGNRNTEGVAEQSSRSAQSEQQP